jgi:hypothetical protein
LGVGTSTLGAWLRAECGRRAALGVAIVSSLLLVPFVAGATPYLTVISSLGPGMDQLVLWALLVCCPAFVVVVAVLAWLRLAARRGLPRWLVVAWALDVPACALVLLVVMFVFIGSGGGMIAH